MKRRWNRALALMVALLLMLAAMALAEAPNIETEAVEAGAVSFEAVETAAALDAVENEAEDEDAAALEVDEGIPEVTAEASDPTVDEAEFDLDELDAEPASEASVEEGPDTEAPVEEDPAAEEGVEEETAEEENVEEPPAKGEPAEDAEDAAETIEESEETEAPGKTVALPTANALTYNGQAQPLVSGEGWLYAMDGEDYGEAIPTAVDAGEYTVYCVPTDETEAEPLPLIVTIAKADVVFIAPVAAGNGEE